MNELKLPGLNKNIINETQTFIEKKLTFKQTAVCPLKIYSG